VPERSICIAICRPAGVLGTAAESRTIRAANSMSLSSNRSDGDLFCTMAHRIQQQSFQPLCSPYTGAAAPRLSFSTPKPASSDFQVFRENRDYEIVFFSDISKNDSKLTVHRSPDQAFSAVLRSCASKLPNTGPHPHGRGEDGNCGSRRLGSLTGAFKS
jgi:hypothetical protein